MVQATAVSALANYADGGSIDMLRRTVDLSHSATVRLVDRLSDAGYVVRRGAEDGRVSSVHLTARGPPRGREGPRRPAGRPGRLGSQASRAPSAPRSHRSWTSWPHATCRNTAQGREKLQIRLQVV